VQLGGLGECYDLPQRSTELCQKRILDHFGTTETTSNDIKFCVIVVRKNKHRNLKPPRPVPLPHCGVYGVSNYATECSMHLILKLRFSFTVAVKVKV